MVQHVTVYRDVKPVKLASIGDAQLMGELCGQLVRQNRPIHFAGGCLTGAVHVVEVRGSGAELRNCERGNHARSRDLPQSDPELRPWRFTRYRRDSAPASRKRHDGKR
jgi:hypothetical protein